MVGGDRRRGGGLALRGESRVGGWREGGGLDCAVACCAVCCHLFYVFGFFCFRAVLFEEGGVESV